MGRKVKEKSVKQQFCFLLASGTPPQTGVIFQTGGKVVGVGGGGSGAERRFAASLWLPLIDAPPAAKLHSRAAARGQQAGVTPDCSLMSPVKHDLGPPMGRLVDKTPACQFVFFKD